MVERIRAIRKWIALRLVGLAYRISPVDVLPDRQSAADLPGGRPTVFRVVRTIAGNSWTLLENGEGAAARKIFEGVRERGELGSMTLEMNAGDGWITRGTYERKAS